MRKLYLKPGKKIGVCAPSDGNYEETDLRRLDNAKANLSKLGFDVKETGHVRVSELGRSADARTRANEVMNLFENHDVGAIFATKGGDFECEILPYIDFGKIAVHQKHFCGYSDNTCLTYSLATLLDMETVYTNNFNEFGMEHLHESLQICLDLLQGKANEQHSYDAYESSYNDRVTGIEDYVLDGKTELKSMNGEEEFEVSGTLLGGCLEVVLQLMGTRFEDTKGFMDYLDELRTNIYGYGSTYVDPETGETKPYDIDHPSSSSLKGMLIDFQSQLEHIISGDQQLSINLGQLKDYLTIDKVTFLW